MDLLLDWFMLGIEGDEDSLVWTAVSATHTSKKRQDWRPDIPGRKIGHPQSHTMTACSGYARTAGRKGHFRILPGCLCRFLPPRHPPNYACRIVARRGRGDFGEFAAVWSDEDIEGWSVGYRYRARTVSVDGICKGEPASLYDNVVADTERYPISAGAVSVKQMNSRVSRLCRRSYPKCRRGKHPGLSEQIPPMQGSQRHSRVPPDAVTPVRSTPRAHSKGSCLRRRQELPKSRWI